MNQFDIARCIIVADETGHIFEVAQLLQRDASEKNVRRILNDLEGETRKCRRNVPLRSMGVSAEFDHRIRGTAIVYNSLSEDLGSFIEYIRPGAFSESILNDDIVALFNHNEDLVLGRKSSRTLVIEDSQEGVSFQCDLPGTQAGRDCYELVRRGDVKGMSFRFVVKPGGDKWTHLTKSKREITRAELIEISPVVWPAYPAASVTARALIEKFCRDYGDNWIRRKRLDLREKEIGHYNNNDRNWVRKKRLELLEKI